MVRNRIVRNGGIGYPLTLPPDVAHSHRHERSGKHHLGRQSVAGHQPRHIRALERFIEKFRKGAIEHGDLQAGRDWTKDMLDENVDNAFYTIFMLLDREDKDDAKS